MTKSKALGTAAETALVRYLQAHGFPYAERRALHGSMDLGDVTGTPGIVWECKAGKAAETASDGQIALWIEETQVEQANAHADHGVLVVKRKGKGEAQVGCWWAIVRGPLMGADGPWVTQRLYLDEYVQWLHSRGYGDAT